MTRSEQTLEPAPVTTDGSPAELLDDEPTGGRRWWRRPWIIPLTVLVAVFLVYIWRPYAAFDPATATVKLVASVPGHYWLVVTHVVTASVAMVTAVLQVWPWLRRNHPRVHRISGRVFVFAGALPTTVVAVVLMAIRNRRDGAVDPGSAGLYLTAIIWFVVTVVGFRAARRRRWRQHRRWMVYSFALSMTNIYSRPLYLLVAATAPAQLMLYFELVGWLPFLVHLMLAKAYLEWSERRRHARRRASVAGRRLVTGGAAR